MGDLHKRFTSIFGRLRRGRGRNRALLSLIPLALFAWLLSGCYVVDAGDRGVEFLLGRFQSVTAPGLHWRVPWPLGSDQLVGNVDQGTDYLHSYPTLLTADHNAVAAEITVHYRITDLPLYLFGNASPTGGGAADILGNLTDAAVSGAVAHAALTDLTGSGVDAVEDAVHDRLLTELKHYPLGIEVSRVTLAKVSAPAPVATAYGAVRRAEAAAQQQSDAADAYAADLLPRTHGEADSRVDAAKAYAAGQVQRAQGDAVAFGDVLVAYRRAPEVTRESLYLSTFEQILGQVDRVVVMGKDGHVTLSFDKPGQVGKIELPPVKPATAGGGHP